MSKLQELIATHIRNRQNGGYSSTVSWRGVEYDPAVLRNRPVVSKSVTETYRGIKHQETIKVEVAK
jgi:hypothetical protein